jgi:hypothetical protein
MSSAGRPYLTPPLRELPAASTDVRAGPVALEAGLANLQADDDHNINYTSLGSSISAARPPGSDLISEAANGASSSQAVSRISAKPATKAGSARAASHHRDVGAAHTPSPRLRAPLRCPAKGRFNL